MKYKKMLFILIFSFIIISVFNRKILAIDGEYSYYKDKTISKICTYSSDNGGDKYLYIYSDNTASVGWNAGGCERTNNKGKCADGYKNSGENEKHPGIMNWSPVTTTEDSYGAPDAYAEYKETKECPGYLAQAVDGSSNRFFLSIGSTASSLSDIQKASKKAPGSVTYSYYNIDTSAFSLDSDLTCQYEGKYQDDTVNFDLKITKDGKMTTENIKKTDKNGRTGYIVNFKLSPKIISSMYLKTLEANKCPKVIDSCHDNMDYSGHEAYTLFGDSSVTITFCNEQDQVTFKCGGDNCSDKDVCQVYSEYKKNLNDDLEGYPSNSPTKNKKMIDNYNLHKSEFNAYCKSVLSTLDYVEGNCIDACIKLSEELSVLEIENGLKSAYNEGAKCNVGSSIVNMIYNVLKWLKYIAPALVIIFTMLDFIKAISSQNDDDMKKAQGKFVKRLIVAALLFLLPLIINFILQTFGLFDSKCDITNLL